MPARTALRRSARRLLVVGIDPDVQSGDDLLRHSRIKQVVALHRRIAVAIGSRCAGRALELLDIADLHQFGLRWRHLARIGGVQRRALEQLVFEPDARTGLIRSHEAVVQVEADSVVNCQFLDRLPFVLEIAAVNPGLQRDVIDERDRM